MRWSSILLAALIASGVAFWLAGPDILRAGGLEPEGAEPAPAAAAAEDATPAPTGAPARTQRAVSVLVLRSQAQSLPNTLVMRGVTEAARKVDVKAQTGGLVISEPLRKGAAVAQGDPLCRIEPGQRPAQLTEAKAMVAKAEAEAEGSARLRRRGFSSGQEVATDAAALEAARASIAQIELDIARTVIAAPFDGVLESDAAEIGSLLQSGDVCATIIALDPIKVVAYAPERSVDQVRPGLRGAARLLSGRDLPVEVSFVARAADPDTRTFLVETTAPNPDGAIRDGMTAELTVPLADSSAHPLPASALTLDGQGRLGVRLAEQKGAEAEDWVARFQPVDLLRDSADGVWVSGPPASANIIIVGQEFVVDGAPIRPSFQNDPSAEE